MFAKKLQISSTLVSRSQDLLSLGWRKLLVPVSLFGVIALLFCLCYIFWDTMDYKIMENNVFIQDLNSAIKENSTLSQHSLNDTMQHKTDSGTVVSEFIENNFKAICKDTTSVKLSLIKCKFPENMLRKNWLCTNLSIEELTFEHCFLSKIEDNAFSSSIYEQTKKISMINNELVSLRKAMFRHLKMLEVLSINENIVKSAEFNLLEEVAGSLTTLDLRQAIDDRKVLRNITGGNALSKLELLSLWGNSISVIDAELFVGVPMVKSLYLHASNIETVSQDTLQPMASSILQITLYSNNIVSLPQGLLDHVVDSNKCFGMFMYDNPWHCDCSLKWLQDFMQNQYICMDQSNVVNSDRKIPICKTPQEKAGKPFTTVDFCSQSTINSTISTTTLKSTKHDWIQTTTITPTKGINNQTTQTPDTTNRMVHVNCSLTYTYIQTANTRKLLSTDVLQFPPRFPHFYVSKVSDRSILVNLPDLNKKITLLWFDNNNVDSSLGCAKNVKYSYLLQNIDSQATYTICLLDDNGDNVSPLNCLAVTTRPTYEYRTWLTNADKSLVFPLLISSLILLFFVGAFLSFLLIRRYPTLLRGNKRIMLVKRRNVDAIVLPKGVDMDEEKQRKSISVSYVSKLYEDGYVTPLPPERMLLPRRSRISRTSSQSDRNSYVSEVETIESQLAFWKLKSELEKQKSIAPPLPPHPSNLIPSVSWGIDTKDDRDYEVFNLNSVIPDAY
ncbi:leucine-rich repeat transmembrane protein FLRT3-like isoform X2 [Bombus vosnesenskii]|uniref:Leucine-rich repeat transmembrane protein FLRT3-like isoform X2 n=1 Tax=Bombus vosnesenskii TaxID=207650 RepID=A0A6J3KN55_9HYME|nr:leucine-rich repeat transmembrane protein FLRT3-like isoform X2 [Bombus vosnesenskii]